MKKVLILFLVILLPHSGIRAATVEEDPIETKTRAIAKTLRCAVCQSESVWESNATLAKQMKQIIRERVAQGQSAEEITEYFLSRYGDYILLKPTKRGLNLALWLFPFILLIAGGGILYWRLSRWVAQSAPRSNQEIAPLNESERRRIEEELRIKEDDSDEA